MFALTLSNKKVQLSELFRIFSALNWAAICDAYPFFLCSYILPCTTADAGPSSWAICPPEWSIQANDDSNLPDFSKHTSFTSFIKGKGFPPPLSLFFIAIKRFDKPSAWLLTKSQCISCDIQQLSQSPVSCSEPQEEVRRCNFITSFLLKAERQTEANLFR